MRKTALVTGASGGIGYELASLLARNNYNLVLTARREDRLREIQSDFERRYDIQVTVIPKDLSRPEAPDEIYSQISADGITVDVIINDAGFGNYGMFAETDWKKEARMLQLNVIALTHLTKLFLPGMLKRWSGKILNLASVAAFMPGPMMAVYYASKAYVLSFSEAIAYELRGTGVTVTVLCPGPTDTGFYKAASLEKSQLFRRLQVADARKVAEFGYHAMLAGKPVAVYGFLNAASVFIHRFLPRKTVTSMVNFIQKERRKQQ